MATKMNLLLKEVNDITECPICTNMFNNPKMLPCFHTFCLECIEQYGKDKKEGDAMPCPMCRKEFKVPTGGFSKLSTNFYIDRLIAVQSGLGKSSVANCDVCTNVGTKGPIVASSFCMICRQNLCDECCGMHKNLRGTMDHKLTPVGEVSEAMKKKLEASFCKKHPIKELEFYCQVCKVPSCATCSITYHKSHETCEIGDTAGEFKKDFRRYIDDVSVIAKNLKKRSEKASQQAESFTDSIDKVEKEIKKRSEEIKTLVDKQTNDMIGQLNFQKALILKNIESQKEELQMNMLICDNFKQFCSKVDAEADSVEVVSVAAEMKTRAEEMKTRPVPELRVLPQMKFIPSGFDITSNQDNIVGELSMKENNDKDEGAYLNNPRFKEKIPLSRSIQGYTTWKDELYVVEFKSPDINVYDIETLGHRRKFTVKGLVDGWDIVAHANVFYVSEYKAKLIHRIHLWDESSSHWTVDSEYLSMSVNKKGNVVVSCLDLNKIIEYTPIGSCVREIQVDAIDRTIYGLQHSIQLDDDRFVICHASTTHHRVCIIDSNGRMMKSYGGGEGSGIGQMNVPCYLTIDWNGFILVTDYNNNRIIQLDASLEFIREFIPESVGLKKPKRMHLHEKKRLLFIGEVNERNINIFDL